MQCYGDELPGPAFPVVVLQGAARRRLLRGPAWPARCWWFVAVVASRTDTSNVSISLPVRFEIDPSAYRIQGAGSAAVDARIEDAGGNVRVTRPPVASVVLPVLGVIGMLAVVLVGVAPATADLPPAGRRAAVPGRERPQPALHWPRGRGRRTGVGGVPVPGSAGLRQAACRARRSRSTRRSHPGSL